MASAHRRERAFTTACFAKAATKPEIGDDELCAAGALARDGKCDDLGNGVFKKRVSQNLYRSIILAKGGRYWVLTDQFAKKDRATIDVAEMKGFRNLATSYERLSADNLADLLEDKEFVEIRHGD